MTLRQITPREGTLGIEWNIQDEYPDLLTLRLDYRAAYSTDWIPLKVSPDLVGQHAWTPVTNGQQYDVRLRVSDRAQNYTEKIIRVAPGAAQLPQASGNGYSSIPPPPAKATMLNTKNIKINYDVTDKGRSDVKLIEVWATQDTKTWKILTSEPPKSPCVNITVPGDGRWGFKLIALSGVDRSEPRPSNGTQPDFWVDIDETIPEVKLLATEMSGDPRNPRMTIRWQAQDKHLAERPISIWYSPVSPGDGNGEWKELASGLPNDGQYIWNIPPDAPFHLCHVRVQAVDQAGNPGIVQTKEPVKVDLSIPKAHVTGVVPNLDGGQALGAPPLTTPR